MSSVEHMRAIIAAGRARQPARIVYDGVERVVEVFTFGLTRASVPVVRVYQRPASSFGLREGWKLLHVEKIQSFTPLKSADPVRMRSDHNPDDAQMERVLWTMQDDVVEA